VAQRSAVRAMQAQFGVSERRACGLVGLGRSTCRYQARRADWPALRERLRNECLNEHWFIGLPHARQIVEAWRVDYNAIRPHSSLGNVSPTEFELCTLDRAARPILPS
jgi:hypothetical protein